MSEESVTIQGLRQLATVFRRVGVDVRTVEDMKDVLWLATWIDPGSEEVEEEVQAKPDVESPLIEPEPPPLPEPDVEDEPSAPIELPKSGKQASDSAASDGVSIQVPTAFALRDRLDLSRSLRPLMRKVPSPARMILDEDATVSQVAEQQIWSLVVRPEPERWLELAIVIEENQTTPIWKDTITEFERLVERQGAFRNVRTWWLAPDQASGQTGTLKLSPFPISQSTSLRSRSPKELLDAAGRRLILLLSDCRSALWHQGTIHKWLAFWSQNAPLSVVQLMPPRLWSQTALGKGFPIWLNSHAPGLTSGQLNVLGDEHLWLSEDDDDDLDDELETEDHQDSDTEENDVDSIPSLQMPIVTLEPEALKQWARVVAGVQETKTQGIYFDGALLTQLIGQETLSSERGRRNESGRSPQDQVKRFQTTVSLTAQKLAGLMAAAPVSPPLVHLLQQTLLPESRQVHVAEVFTSGLLRPIASATYANDTLVQYEFLSDEIRELLIDEAPISQTISVLDVVSQYIAQRIGKDVKSFEALLANKEALTGIDQQEVLPFAHIASRVLRRLGGEYASIADQLEMSSVQGSEFEIEPEHFPKQQSFEFTEATIFVVYPFEFDMAYVPFSSDGQTSLDTLDRVVFNQAGQSLSDAEMEVLRGTLAGQTYNNIAHQSKFSPDYLSRDVGPRLWRFLQSILLENVTKRNFNAVLQRWMTNRQPLEASKVSMVLKKQGWRFIEQLEDSFKLEMVSIPRGRFTMGSPDKEDGRSDAEGPLHPVTIQPFFMGKYPITQAQWRAVADLPQVERELEPNPSRFSDKDDSPQRPVERITWYDAVEFCARLSQATGREYRLPSEAEWEYACRAGTTTPFHFGETITTDLANYDGDHTYRNGPEGVYRGETTPVGSFPANAFGLHDMHGNVWEWCADHWHEDYTGAPENNTIWSSSSESALRVLRGGSWLDVPELCRSATRVRNLPDDWFDYIGLRVVCAAART